jgi:hypothetical protein
MMLHVLHDANAVDEQRKLRAWQQRRRRLATFVVVVVASEYVSCVRVEKCAYCVHQKVLLFLPTTTTDNINDGCSLSFFPNSPQE